MDATYITIPQYLELPHFDNHEGTLYYSIILVSYNMEQTSANCKMSGGIYALLKMVLRI